MSQRPESFLLKTDPLTGEPIDPPEQLELKPKPPPGVFTRNARRIIRQHQRGIDDGN